MNYLFLWEKNVPLSPMKEKVEIRIRNINHSLLLALKKEAKEKRRKSIHEMARVILMEKFNIQ